MPVVARHDDTTDDTTSGAAEALAAIAGIGVAALLVVIRGSVDNSVTVLVLAAVVSLCGALGGWRAGLAGAVAAAVSFNFFHTRPYLSLRIHDADDILTAATLLIVGVIAGLTSSVAHRRRQQVVATHDELAAIERVADLVATSNDPADVETAVRAELLSLLGLSACSVEATLEEGMPSLGRGGALADAARVYHDGGFELPATGVAIPVLRTGSVVGHLVCTPAPGVAVSVARRRAAVTLADLLGMSLALGRNAGPVHHN